VSIVGPYITYLQISRRLMNQEEVLYNTLIEFGITMTLVWLIKTFSDEMYSKVC